MKKAGKHVNQLSSLYARAHAFGRFCLAACLWVLLASGVQAAQKPASKQIAPSAPIQTSNPDLDSSKSTDRLFALEADKKNGHRISASKLKAKLKTENNPLVRHRLNQALASSDSPDVVKTLVDSLKTDSDPMVRQGAAQSLSKFAQDPAAINALAAALKADNSSPVRYACALSLSLSNTPVSLAALELASADSDPLLRRQVAYGLKRNPGKKAQQILRKLQSDSDPSVRRVAGGRN